MSDEAADKRREVARLGGLARGRDYPAEKRQEWARKAARARWGRKKRVVPSKRVKRKVLLRRVSELESEIWKLKVWKLDMIGWRETMTKKYIRAVEEMQRLGLDPYGDKDR